MKHLLALLAFAIATPAIAADFAAMRNRAEGEIVLTDVAGDACMSSERIAYARAAGGLTIFGCWHPGDSFVFVRWKTSDGIEVRTYPYDGFVPIGKEVGL